MNRFKALFQPGIIVSCQVYEGEPLYAKEGHIMDKMALAAEQSGAVGIRANGTLDVPQILQAVSLPVIAIFKRNYPDAEVYITATMQEVDELMAIKGVQAIAVDCTIGKRHLNEPLAKFIADIKAKYPEVVIMADIASYEEGINAAKLGVDAISTTMYGNTAWSTEPKPGIEIVRRLASELTIPVNAEGGIYSEEHIHLLFEAGAYNCIIGGAITRPQEVTERIVSWYRDTQEEQR